MRRTAPIIFSFALVVAALVPALSSAGRPASPERRAAAASAGIVSHRVTETRAEVLRYWTPKRMRNARPAEVLLDDNDQLRVMDAPHPTEPPVFIEPSEAEASIALTRAGGRAGGAAGPIPYTRVEITNTSDAPFRTHGKVYFSADGGDYVCSGSVVTSSGENLVVTAGHCVYDASGFSTNFLFHPGFRTGTSPYGAWTASELFTTDQYASNDWENPDYTYDVGMALMALNGSESLEDTVDARGIAFNQDPSAYTYEAFGYPAGAPFRGNKMYRCTSDIGFRDGTGAVAPMAIGCDMTGGSSGGGWVIDQTYVNSVVSYGYDGEPEVLYGPYFGTVIQDLYGEVTGDDPGPQPTPTGTPEPSPTPTSTPDPVAHDVSLTLTMKRHLQATGRMSVPDGYLPCRRSAPVEIYRLIDSDTGTYMGEGVTHNDGRFGIKIKDRPGRYFAYGPPGPVNDLNLCLEAYSLISRHRHK